jgi:hypothetical protein
LITNSPIEEKILSRASEKMNMNNLVVEAGKFHAKSKEADRRAMLESLIKMENENEHVDSSASGEGGASHGNTIDDDELNSMMALTDQELHVYQEMDIDRIERERRLYGDAFTSRLMGMADVPRWLQDAEAAEKRKDEYRQQICRSDHAFLEGSSTACHATSSTSSSSSNALRHPQLNHTHPLKKLELASLRRRKRKKISYRDMSEAQFSRILERGGGNDDDDDDDDDGRGSCPSSEDGMDEHRKDMNKDLEPMKHHVMPPKKKHRPQPLDLPPSSSPSSSSSSTPSRAVRCPDMAVLRSIYDAVLRAKDSTGRLRHLLFLEKPSALDYPYARRREYRLLMAMSV